MVEPIALRMLEIPRRKKKVKFCYSVYFDLYFYNIGKYRTPSHTAWREENDLIIKVVPASLSQLVADDCVELGVNE